MNGSIFKSMLSPFWKTWAIRDFADAADKIATAYELANLGSTSTFFGAKLIRGNKDILKTFLQLGMGVNFSLPLAYPRDKVEPGFMLMATGFCLYWMGATFSPMPPMPPMMSPMAGVQVIFPGIPRGLDMDIKKAFQQGDTDSVLQHLYIALMKHQLTVSGIYSGILPSVPTPIPMILPWTGLFSL